jgi:hypothetical protein
MASVTLLHPEETFKIPAVQAMTKCSLFQNNPGLLLPPYEVQSPVSLSIFREFVSTLEGNPINITHANFTDLDRLCNEFGFSELASKLSDFRPSMNFQDSNARGRIAFLEETTNQHDHDIELLHTKVIQLSTDFGRLVGEVSSLRSASAGIQTLSKQFSALKTQISQKRNDPVAEQLSTEFIELRKEVLTLKAQIAAMSPSVTLSLPNRMSPSPRPISQPFLQQPSVPSVDSRIISGFPEIFAEFRKNQISLLWRGSRDGLRREFCGSV